jgi:hypothetical protein
VADAWDIEMPAFNDHDPELVCAYSAEPIAYAPPDELETERDQLMDERPYESGEGLAFVEDQELERELVTMLDEAAADNTTGAQLERMLIEELVEEEFENDDDGETNE